MTADLPERRRLALSDEDVPFSAGPGGERTSISCSIPTVIPYSRVLSLCQPRQFLLVLSSSCSSRARCLPLTHYGPFSDDLNKACQMSFSVDQGATTARLARLFRYSVHGCIALADQKSLPPSTIGLPDVESGPPLSLAKIDKSRRSLSSSFSSIAFSIRGKQFACSDSVVACRVGRALAEKSNKKSEGLPGPRKYRSVWLHYPSASGR
ncbi:hypothetical protein QBC44DRAFT_16680 [Cladorrhinum sp. PSN332]|nr:hypothetical protein QBC44DRAFT_16680 [Cladorrhinum sp. PSN332]